MSTKHVLTTTEVANLRACTSMTVRNAIERGDLRAERVGYQYTIRLRDALRWAPRRPGRKKVKV